MSPLDARRPAITAVLMGLVVSVCASASAPAATPGPDCCFAAARAVSGPLPAGELRFGVVADGAPHAVVRQAGGALTAAEFGTDRRFGAAVAFGIWAFRDPQTADVDGDGLDDLLGRDGGTVVVGRATGTGFMPPTPLARLPRAYAVMVAGDLEGTGHVDLAALDPASRRLRILQAPSTDDADTLAAGRWATGYSFALADVDDDGRDDAVGVDRAGRVRVGINNGAGFTVRHVWRIPARATLAIADVTGDGRADLIYRPAGSDDVSVRRAGPPPGAGSDAEPIFHRARRWGRWNRRWPLTTALLEVGGRAGLAARDPSTGRIMYAKSLARAAR